MRGAAAAAVALSVAAVVVHEASAGADPTAFQPSFGSAGLVSNEFAHFAPADPRAHVSPDWDVTSGSLFARHGAGWTGTPDGDAPDPESRLTTGSSVFRVVTRRSDFGDTTVDFTLRLVALGSTARTPPKEWDGVHVWLRYQDPTKLYVLSVRRRDGAVAIKRKLPGGASNGGTYLTLAQTRAAPRDVVRVRTEVRNIRDAVWLALFFDDELILQTIDTSRDRIDEPGAVGIRGDNAEFEFRDFTAARGSAGPR